jgi:hypothetical protein
MVLRLLLCKTPHDRPRVYVLETVS